MKALKLFAVAVVAGALAYWSSLHSGIGWSFVAMYLTMGAFVASGMAVYFMVSD